MAITKTAGILRVRVPNRYVEEETLSVTYQEPNGPTYHGRLRDSSLTVGSSNELILPEYSEVQSVKIAEIIALAKKAHHLLDLESSKS